MSRPRVPRGRRRAAGVVLLGLLIALVLLGLTAMAACDVWAVAKRREQEQQLLFVGEQYRAAIRRYHAVAPAGRPHTYPTSLEQLLEDRRFPTPQRHLRRLYPDPMTGAVDWRLDRLGEAIVGVRSSSAGAPLKQSGFPGPEQSFEGRAHYSDWAFDAGSG